MWVQAFSFGNSRNPRKLIWDRQLSTNKKGLHGINKICSLAAVGYISVARAEYHRRSRRTITSTSVPCRPFVRPPPEARLLPSNSGSSFIDPLFVVLELQSEIGKDNNDSLPLTRWSDVV